MALSSKHNQHFVMVKGFLLLPVFLGTVFALLRGYVLISKKIY